MKPFNFKSKAYRNVFSEIVVVVAAAAINSIENKGKIPLPRRYLILK